MFNFMGETKIPEGTYIISEIIFLGRSKVNSFKECITLYFAINHFLVGF